MAGNSSQAAGTNDAALELWCKFFGHMDEASREMEVLRIKAVILNHRHEQPIDLLDSLRRLQLMQLFVDIPKSIGIEDAVCALPKSHIIKELVRDIKKGWKVRPDQWIARQALMSSSPTPMTAQQLKFRFNNDVILTTFTSSAREVERFINKVHGDHRHHLVVGLDTEWLVVQKDGDLRHRTALLQLCVDKRCLVFQIHHAHVIPNVLKDFLECPWCMFVGADVKGDIRRLSTDFKIEVHTWSDLQTGAHKFNTYSSNKPSLKDIAQKMMDVTMDKDIVHMFWGEPELTLSQIKYAAVDAYVSSKLGLLMNIKPVTN